MSTATANALPDIHPGTPSYGRVTSVLLVIKDTPAAWLVQLPSDQPGRTTWVPKSQARVLDRVDDIIRVDKPAGGQRIHFETRTVNLPVWLYRKVRAALN